LFKSKGSVLRYYMLVIQQNILEAMDILWKKNFKMLVVAGNFFQKCWWGKT